MIQSKYFLGNKDYPVLALAIHNGHQIPPALARFTKISDEDCYREEDPHTGQFVQHFPNHIIVETSRFAVDLNRRREKCVYIKPEDAWDLETRTCELPEALLLDLFSSYDNWYKTLVYQVERLLSVHPFLIVLDIHSYNHRRGGPSAEPDPQSENPDIILGRSNMSQIYYPLVEDLRQNLDGKQFWNRKLDVRCDVKFSGGQLARFLNERYPERLFCLAVEFKKIFMNEWSGKINPVLIFELRKLFMAEVLPWIDQSLASLRDT